MGAIISIVGRPNVGKSTLFNALSRKALAIVDAKPGVTRDRRQSNAFLGDLRFTLMDTPGWVDDGEEGDEALLAAGMREQTSLAVKQSHFVLFLVDGKAGPNSADAAILGRLRRMGRPFVLVINKCEGNDARLSISQFWSLNVDDFVAISAAHCQGFDALYESIAPFIPSDKELHGHTVRFLRLTVLGRPNVGKSTLINRIVGENRLLTAPTAGVTRDAVVLSWQRDKHRYELVDTAGMRRQSRSTLEDMSLSATRRALRLTQVACLVVSASSALEKQDMAIFAQILKEGRAPLIVINKCDLWPRRLWRRYTDAMVGSLPQARGVEVVACSALSGDGVDRILPAAAATIVRWSTRIDTGLLNRWLKDHIERHPPPRLGGRQLKIRYVTQVSTRPPSFALFANLQKHIPQSYLRYLSNGLRAHFALDGMPVRLHVRKSANAA